MSRMPVIVTGLAHHIRASFAVYHYLGEHFTVFARHPISFTSIIVLSLYAKPFLTQTHFLKLLLFFFLSTPQGS